MKLKMYSVYDSKVNAWLQPVYLRNRGEASRAFTETVNDPKSQFFKHSNDYEIFEIGDFDDESGRVLPYEAKISIGIASEYKKNEQQNQLTSVQ